MCSKWARVSKTFSPGDHVVVTLIRSCGHCGSSLQWRSLVTCGTAFTRDTHTPLRREHGEALTQGVRTGAFAEAVVVDASQVVTIPREMKLDVGLAARLRRHHRLRRRRPHGEAAIRRDRRVLGTGGVGR